MHHSYETMDCRLQGISFPVTVRLVLAQIVNVFESTQDSDCLWRESSTQASLAVEKNQPPTSVAQKYA